MITTDYCKFTRSEMEVFVKQAARIRLTGPFFVGHIGDQHVRWLEDGGIEVLTDYERGQLPVVERPLPQIASNPGRSPFKKRK